VSLGVSEPNMSCAFAAAKIRVTSDARLMIAKTRFRVDAWIMNRPAPRQRMVYTASEMRSDVLIAENFDPSVP
jgi:hypothetical protein